MKIIISPAKTMQSDPDAFPVAEMPEFLEETKTLLTQLRQYDGAALKALLGCSDALAELNYRRYQEMELERKLTPALFAYEGLQYRHMAPAAFTETEYCYLEEHLRIMSAFYGVLRPMDGIVPYRLEMQAKPEFCGSMYQFWGEKLGASLGRDNDLVINLASKEYSTAARRGLPAYVKWVSVYFGTVKDGKFREKGTLCKMARGTMVRFMAERNVQTAEELLEFRSLGFQFCPERSDSERLYFVQMPENH